LDRLFKTYAALAARADASFQKLTADYGDLVRCKPGCADCCHAVFGLFPMEAVVVKERFDRLPRKERRAALQRAAKSDRDLRKLRERITGDPDASPRDIRRLATERVRCPLLNEDQACILYAHRPITCRVYGIPTLIQGQVRSCGKSGFEKGRSYPAFNLDAAYAELHRLSTDLLAEMGVRDLRKASFLYAVSRVIRGPFREMMDENPE
jgi:Fe-S-cluster containining protein